MRILVVEDDSALGPYLQKALQNENHRVELVADGESAVQHVMIEAPELIVLDLGLPRLDGMDVLRRVKAISEETSVLVLTGRSGLQDRLGCLDAGADDLMLKPFSFAELAARCRALQRKRSHAEGAAVLRYGALEVHRFERRVRWCGSAVDLTVKEFALLEYLMLNRGRCVDRSELLREVWTMSPDTGTNVVDVYVNYLRRKLSAAAVTETCPIATVRGKGYVIGGVEKRSVMAVLPSPAMLPQPVFA